MPTGLSVWWIPHALCDILGQLEGKYLLPKERDDAVHDPMRRATRVALRLVLGATRGASWGREPFVMSSDGRPYIERPMAPVFSVSHTRTAGLVAVSNQGPLGVDVEKIRAIKLGRSYLQSIIRAAMHYGIWDGDPSISGSSCLEGEVRSEAKAGPDPVFLIVWTRLEAIAKARGGGIGALLEDLGARPSAGHGADLGSPTRPATSVIPAGCSLWPLALPCEHVGAVVAPTGPSPPPLQLFPTSRTELDQFCQKTLTRC